MRRMVPLISVCLLLAAAADPAFAQQRLFARMQSEVVELDSRSESLGTVIRRFPLPAGTRASGNRDAVPFGGGEFLAWVADQYEPAFYPQGVALLNTQSGAVQRFTFSDFNARQVIGTDGNTRLLVLGTNASGRSLVLVADARSASTHFLDVGYDVSPFQTTIAYAAASDVLFVAKPRGPGADTYHDIDVIQASTGMVFKTVDIWPVSVDVLATNAAGTRLFVTDALNGTFAFDVPSGTQSASNRAAYLGSTRWAPALDERRNRLLLHIDLPDGANPEFPSGLSAFSADSLQFIGNVRVPKLPLPPPTPDSAPHFTEELDFSGLSATIFVLQGMQEFLEYYVGPCRESQLIALDAGTGQVRRAVSTTAALGAGACDAELVRVTEPAPPSAPTADVAGNQVMLKWQAPFGATQYEIEAGSAPGLANLATIPVSDAQLVIDGVPSGTYHLRVRAINTIGKSGASREIQVIVP